MDMDAYRRIGSVSRERARELVEQDGWAVHGFIEEHGDPVSILANDETMQAVTVRDSDDPPGPWPDA